ncbi:cryptochrome/deoxyribodipyrimidine photo-lyase family protein [Echinicola salinicaeni]|uniref:cryptochrome/deoxyribodipyrimidine photo-lyase family protein n=1 Tax=Echinicola salinicaeni TaxID=2762757 RepID=UPI0016453031|nr:FAD-binding domain-containing protein [Echinicola salinicaeni]
MAKKDINIVWLKRDLRLQDHWPLKMAEEAELPYLIIYCFEPSLIKYPDTSLRHLQFVYHSIEAMNKELAPFQKQVDTFYAEAVEVFSLLMEYFNINNVWAYQESGTQLTWDRDKAVSKLLIANQVNWEECQKDGVIRGIRNREGWDRQWYQMAHSSIIQNRYKKGTSLSIPFERVLPTDLGKKIKEYPKAFQPAGEKNAWHYLESFVNKRGMNYRKHISKPMESRQSCGRISPYLAWGNLSIRQAYQYVRQHENYPKQKAAFNAFLTRLKWHCHFIQKFEVECNYEHTCINRGYELLHHPEKSSWIEAWENGYTGYPLVDACMRCLRETGWINFRMRAMLVSFFCHHLFQDWRKGHYHLARLFLDYEPGIHYTQFQMQAGTTGVNTLRIYNPVKQSQDHDPEGNFIKRWVPELEKVSSAYIHEPWKMPQLEQQMTGFIVEEAYSVPVVDIHESAKKARKAIWGHRKNEQVQVERERIINTHTRNSISK